MSAQTQWTTPPCTWETSTTTFQQVKTLRDEFAMAALMGHLAGMAKTASLPGAALTAKNAYRYADAMLKEREDSAK